MKEIVDLLRDFQPVITALIAFTGIATLWNTTRLWRMINRPIIIAYVHINESSQSATTYNLVVKNVGNLAATKICLYAKKDEIMSCVQQEYKNEMDSPGFSQSLLEGVLDCFSEKSKISILASQESTSNALGMTSGNSQSNLWIYGSSFPVKITYEDLSRKKYKSQIELVIKDRDMFANLQWKDSRESSR